MTIVIGFGVGVGYLAREEWRKRMEVQVEEVEEAEVEEVKEIEE